MKIVLASGNKNKYREMKEEFLPLGIELLFGGDFGNPPEIEETGDTYRENALLKARGWAEAVALPSMSDDSGLEVEVLGGVPGVHSARIIPGSDADRTAWLAADERQKPQCQICFMYRSCLSRQRRASGLRKMLSWNDCIKGGGDVRLRL